MRAAGGERHLFESAGRRRARGSFLGLLTARTPGQGHATPPPHVGVIVAVGDLAVFADAGQLISAARPGTPSLGLRTPYRQPPPEQALQLAPLRRVFCLPDQASIIREGPNCDYCVKK